MASQHSRVSSSTIGKQMCELVGTLYETYSRSETASFLRFLATEAENAANAEVTSISTKRREHAGSMTSTQDSGKRSQTLRPEGSIAHKPINLDSVTDATQAGDEVTIPASTATHPGRVTRSMIKRKAGTDESEPSELPRTPTKRRRMSSTNKKGSESLSTKAEEAYNTALRHIQHGREPKENEVVSLAPVDKWVTTLHQARDEVVQRWTNAKKRDVPEDDRKRTAVLATAPVLAYFSEEVFGIKCFTRAYDFAKNAEIQDQALRQATDHSLSLVDELVDSYVELTRVENDIEMASRWRLLRLAEFYKRFNRLEKDAHDPTSDFSKELKDKGHVCKKGVGIRSLVLNWFIEDHKIPIKHEPSDRSAYLKNYMHGQLNLGHKLSIVTDVFGKGIFAILPAGSDVHIRGWKIEVVEAVCRHIKSVISEAQTLCDNLRYDVVEPLILGNEPTRRYAALTSAHSSVRSDELAKIVEELLRPRPVITEVESDVADAGKDGEQDANLHSKEGSQSNAGEESWNSADDAISDALPNGRRGAVRSVSYHSAPSSPEKSGSTIIQTVPSTDQVAIEDPSEEPAVLPPTSQEHSSSSVAGRTQSTIYSSLGLNSTPAATPFTAVNSKE